MNGHRLQTALLVAVSCGLWVPGAAHAQPTGCSVLAGTRSAQNLTTPSGVVSHMSRPRLRCNDGRYIEADSLVHYQVSGYTNLLRRVVFRADGRELRADSAQYYENIGRLDANGDVTLRELERGTVITGGELLYLRAGPQRPQEQLTVTGGRPTATLFPRRDTLREEAAPSPDSVTPYHVVADRIFLVGDQFFQAQGTVEVTRDSLSAFSDSLSFDQVGGALDLTGTPARVLQGALDLEGRSLRVLMPGDVISEVIARDDAVLVTDSLDVDAPFIRIFMADGELERLVAAVPREVLQAARQAATAAAAAAAAAPEPEPRPASELEPDEEDEVETLPRAVATGTNIVMEADSIDVTAPAQRIEEMVAVGDARAVSTSRDSLNTADTPEPILNDWIEGDTVRATFAPMASATEPGATHHVLESLRAQPNARSLYRLDPDSTQRADTTAFQGRLPVNYTEADGVVLFFVEGRVVRIEYDGLRRGIQLQPIRRPDDAARRAGGLEDTP